MFGSARKQQTRQFLLKIVHAVLPNVKKNSFKFQITRLYGFRLGLFPLKSEDFECGQMI